MKTIMIFFILLLSTFIISPSLNAQELIFKINKKYINIPVAHKMDEALCIFGIKTNVMTVSIEDEPYRGPFAIRVAPDTAKYWVFYDVSKFQGKTVKITYIGNPNGLRNIYQSDEINGQDSLYKETKRPQLHFTSRRGYNNDPNGLIYLDGEYHLFYQHNPWERMWGNWVWGHAVSKDLIHWEELPPAIFPDELGQPYSGTATIDYNNTAGFNKGNTPAMLLFYTSDDHTRGLQSMAYSLDRGRTFTKFKGNPLLDSRPRWNNSRDTRDPHVFWHEESKKWIMVLFEVDGFSIYTSNNLKEWEYESHNVGLAECPQLYELPVDGNMKNTKWVMNGARGLYMIGTFDGKKFIPEVGPLYYGTRNFAAQTFANVPKSDGRRIQMAWGQIEQPNMPFNQQMLIPTELTLHKTKNGIRLFNYPVKEFDKLQTNEYSWNSLTPEKASEVLHQYNNSDCLRIKLTFKISEATNFGMNLFGQSLFKYEMANGLINGFYYENIPENRKDMEITADIIIDKTSVEVFVYGGAYCYNMQRTPDLKNNEGFHFWGNTAWEESNPVRGKYLEIKNMKVYNMKSIWKKYK